MLIKQLRIFLLSFVNSISNAKSENIIVYIIVYTYIFMYSIINRELIERHRNLHRNYSICNYSINIKTITMKIKDDNDINI